MDKLTKLKKNDQLVDILKEAGIVASEYAHPSAVGTPAEFIIGTVPGGRGILIKNSEMAILSVATDKQHRQAVLSVKEGKRKITKLVKIKRRTSEGRWTEGQAKQELRGRFPVAIPDAEMTIRKVTMKTGHYRDQSEYIKYSAYVTASVTKTRTNTFLLGMDEVSHFISILPKQVKSVKEAHDLLRPEGVPEGTKRQGEFFFVPTTDKIDEKKIRHSVPLEKGSKHHAQYAIPERVVRTGAWDRKTTAVGALYVKGLIFDKRGYRHAPTDLGNVWHKVIRNKEVNIPVPQGTRAARYD